MSEESKVSAKTTINTFSAVQTMVNWCRTTAFVVAFVAWSLAFISLSVAVYKTAREKRLSAETIELKKLNVSVNKDDVLFVSSDLGRYPFMTSRWIAYYINKIPVIFAPSLHEGGYIFGLDNDYEKLVRRTTLVLTKTPDIINGKQSADIVLASDNYQVRRLSPPDYILLQGFHEAEGWGRWIGADAELIVVGYGAAQLELSIGNVYSATTPSTQSVEISVNNVKTIHEVLSVPASIQVALDPSQEAQRVHIKSLEAPASPSLRGDSSDARVLTLGINKIQVSTDNAK